MKNNRRQLNICLDKEPELYEAIKAQARRLDMSVSAFLVLALKSSLDWQIPLESAELLKRVQSLEKSVRDLTLWKKEAELQQVRKRNAQAIELDNLKTQVAKLENALKRIEETAILVPEESSPLPLHPFFKPLPSDICPGLGDQSPIAIFR